MIQRIITGILLIAYAFGLIALGAWYPIAVDLLIYSFMLLCIYEMLHSLKEGGYKPYGFFPSALGIASLPMAYFFNITGVVVTLAVCLLAVMIQFVFSKTKSLNDLTATIFTMIYPTIFISLAFVITREFNAVYIACLILLVPIFSDTFAYFTGRTFKGPKLCPAISPKKTVSGAVGGVLGGTFGASVVYLLFDYFAVFGATIAAPVLTGNRVYNLLIYLAIGFVGSILSQFGDLFASRIKRSIGIKDFGKIFPGHGGGLDRLDSVMFMLVTLFVVFSFV